MERYEEDNFYRSTKRIIKELLEDKEISQQEAAFIQEYIKSNY